MKVKDLILTALFAALTAIGAFLGFKFVLASITLQFLFTAMAGVLLGRKYGALSQAVYVLLGLVGVPIFAQGGGFSYVLQPTFGFLLGLIPAAWVIGVLAKRPLKFWRTALAMLAGLAVLYAIGVPAILNLALPSLLVTFLNGLLAAFSESYVVVLGIYYKLQTFLYLPANGIVQGMRPLIGYNYGAKEHLSLIHI